MPENVTTPALIFNYYYLKFILNAIIIYLGGALFIEMCINCNFYSKSSENSYVSSPSNTFLYVL